MIILYIDPGTGSMLFSVLLGVGAALMFAARKIWIRVKTAVLGGKAEKMNKDRIPTTAREHDTCPPIAAARSSRILKFSGLPTPRPPDTRILASMISLISDTALTTSLISTYLLSGLNPGLYSITSALAPFLGSIFCITPGRTVSFQHSYG